MPGAQNGTQWQVQAQVDPGGLGSTPGQAYTRAGQIVHRVERTLPGQVQFVDNLSDQLNTAAGDALYAETLYIMLAVPGALVALGLAYLAALGTVERDRRDLALLRARGATRRDLLLMASAESATIGVVAGLLGAGAALAAVSLIISGGVGLTAARAAITVAACVALAIVGALAARLGASASVWRASVSESRRAVQRRAQAAVAAALPRPRRARAQRADLLADRQHRVLRGAQPRLQPHPVAVGVHVLRAGAAVARRDAAARAPPRRRARVGGQPRHRRARAHPARVPARQRRPARPRRSTAGCSWSGCCSRSA